jgi:histidinol dehydrogenase
MIPIIDDKDRILWQARLERAADENESIRQRVREIIEKIRTGKDTALLKLTQIYDGADLSVAGFAVTEAEYLTAGNIVGKETLTALETAVTNITEYHSRQRRQGFEISAEGVMLRQIIRPVACAAIYVPGGKAAYPSSVLMNAIPAKVAGVRRIVMATPPSRDGSVNPLVLMAAKMAGVEAVYKIGGAQAIAALAYGTESIPAVDKIVGPGNAYVAEAKRQVYGQVGIDMIAGPSEILIIADCTADPGYIAADMLSQAEHDEMAASVLVTDSRDLAEKVAAELDRQCEKLPKGAIARTSLLNHGMAIICSADDACVAVSNAIAPEHLEIMTHDPEKLLAKVENAGSIFLGTYSPEPLGDYMAGPNHVLPTGGTARFSSPLSVDDFIKKSSVIQYSKERLGKLGDAITCLARAEGLEAHARAIEIRMKESQEASE